jgi:phosphate transport system permease protein
MNRRDEEVRQNLQAADLYIHTQAEKTAARKKTSDKAVRGVFLTLVLLCCSVIFVVAGFIAYKGLLPFIRSYTQNGETGSASFSYFLSGLRFDDGFDALTGTFHFGVFYLVINTLYINFIAALFAVPTAVLTSLFIARIAPDVLAKIIQTGVDLLAAIPSVIYGIFGVGVIVPLVKAIARGLGMSAASGISLLSGALILALMSIPTMISLGVTALKAVDENLIKASLALGASKTQTNFKVCLKAAKSGIFAGIILGLGRALGEATAVSMVCGSPTYGITSNPFNPTVTLTSQMLLSLGEAVPNSLNYDIRFSAGVVLMIIIVLTNFLLDEVKEQMSSVDRKPLFAVRVYQRMKSSLRSFLHGIRRS